MPFADIYRGRRVLVTGHTGFKGTWLCEWLLMLGAKVAGLALDPREDQRLFDLLRLSPRLEADLRHDVRDPAVLRRAISEYRPAVIFHLAAQPLVRLSYEIPLETFAVNVMGTANLLDAVRLSGHPCSVVVVTTDKCYENREWLHSCREDDPLGGHDPYSASKGCAELVVASYRRSFFSHPDSSIRAASARAGNVIGGGDWAADRIVPDCIRAVQAGRPVPVRNRHATRPWQHVLEPLSGYLWLGAALSHPPLCPAASPSLLASAFNFGPNLSSNRAVADLVDELLASFPKGIWEDRSEPGAPHEASKLNLAVDKAFHLLEWQPVWDFPRTVAETAAWYKASPTQETAPPLTRSQIESYVSSACQLGLAWAI